MVRKLTYGSQATLVSTRFLSFVCYQPFFPCLLKMLIFQSDAHSLRSRTPVRSTLPWTSPTHPSSFVTRTSSLPPCVGIATRLRNLTRSSSRVNTSRLFGALQMTVMPLLLCAFPSVLVFRPTLPYLTPTRLPQLGDNPKLKLSPTNPAGFAHIGAEIKMKDQPQASNVAGSLFSNTTIVKIQSAFSSGEVQAARDSVLSMPGEKEREAFEIWAEKIPLIGRFIAHDTGQFLFFFSQ